MKCTNYILTIFKPFVIFISQWPSPGNKRRSWRSSFLRNILDASRYWRPSHPSTVHDLLSRTYVAVLISRRTAFTASYEHGFLEIGFPTTTEGGQHERRGCCRRDPFSTWISQRNPHSSVFCFFCMLGWYLHHL